MEDPGEGMQGFADHSQVLSFENGGHGRSEAR